MVIKMTNNKQKRTAMKLSDSLVREIKYYCEENGIDTTLGFELAKSIRRENDLVATYVDLGEDGYADWISDIITNHFEEETVTKQDTKIQDWFELMILSQLEAFKSSIEDDKDSPLDVAAIEKDYQEWLRELPTMCQRIGADLHAIKNAVGIPDSLIK